MRRGRSQRASIGAWISRLRRWRFPVSAAAIYALVLQALFGGVAVAAPIAAGSSALVICTGGGPSGDGARLADAAGAAHQQHGDACVCQGLCAHHGGAAPVPSFRAVGLRPVGEAIGLALPMAITASELHNLRHSGFARAPPSSGRDIA